MGGVDDLIDDADEDADERQVQEAKDKLDIEDKEELEELDDRLSRAYKLILQYDSRIEQLEEEVETLRSTVVKLILEDNNENDSDSADRPDSGEKLFRDEEDDSDSDNGLEW